MAILANFSQCISREYIDLGYIDPCRMAYSFSFSHILSHGYSCDNFSGEPIVGISICAP